MQIRCALLGAMLFFGSFPAHAQAWLQEPETVLGIVIGAPIDPVKIPTCLAAKQPTEGVCLKYESDVDGQKSATIGNFPYSYALGIVDFDGKLVSRIRFRFSSDDYSRMREILFERYGPPSRVDTTDVTTANGTVLPNEIALWTGKRMGIILQRRFLKANQAMATFYDTSLAKARSKALSDEVRKDASKL